MIFSKWKILYTKEAPHGENYNLHLIISSIQSTTPNTYIFYNKVHGFGGVNENIKLGNKFHLKSNGNIKY